MIWEIEDKPESDESDDEPDSGYQGSSLSGSDVKEDEQEAEQEAPSNTQAKADTPVLQAFLKIVII